MTDEDVFRPNADFLDRSETGTVFVTDQMTSQFFEPLKSKKKFLLWLCTIKPSLVAIQKTVAKLQPPKKNFDGEASD